MRSGRARRRRTQGRSPSRIQPHENKDGSLHWYGFYKLPAEYGGKTITVRLHQNEDDTSRTLNRTEILRPIPEGSDDFTRLHVLRADAESINRGMNRALTRPGRPAPAEPKGPATPTLYQE